MTTKQRSATQPHLFLDRPAHNRTATSKAAADAIEPARESITGSILHHIAWCGDRGATQEEISQACKLARATVAGACNTLGKAGRIVALEETRNTKAKTPAMVHVTPDNVSGRPLMQWPLSNGEKTSDALAKLHTRINQLERALQAMQQQLASVSRHAAT